MTHYQGSKRYIALQHEILMVTVVAEGAQGFTFPKGQKPKRPYTVSADRPAKCGVAAGDVFCVGEEDLFSNPIEASRVAMARNEDEDDYDEDEEDEEDEDADEEE